VGLQSSESIEREIRVSADVETVFAFLIEPEKLVQWMGTTATLDARPGGGFRLDYNGVNVARGEFLEVDPPHRVSYSWGWEEPGAATPPGSSVVTFVLVADGDETIVRLTHTGLVGDEIASHGEGWDYFLPGLVRIGAEALANG